MRLRGTGGRGPQRRYRERGAVAVESAIVTPLVLMLFFGIVELGFLFKDYLAVAGSVRAGVRMASANPRTSTFAQDAADKVAQTGGAANFNDVQELWIYKAATTSDKPISHTTFDDCDVCVKFDWDAGSQTFVERTGGPNSWLADNQNACSASGGGGPGPDRIGVYLKLKHDAFTKFVFDSVDLADASILTFEPIPVQTGCS